MPNYIHLAKKLFARVLVNLEMPFKKKGAQGGWTDSSKREESRTVVEKNIGEGFSFFSTVSSPRCFLEFYFQLSFHSHHYLPLVHNAAGIRR